MGAARALDAPGFDFSPFDQLREAVVPGLRARLLPHEWKRVEGWWDAFLCDEALRKWPLAVTHGDVWWGNLLVEHGRLSGIIDWEFLAVGDPAWDLASARQMGDTFHGVLLREYTALAPLDDGAGHRMAQWWALRVFFGVRFAADRRTKRSGWIRCASCARGRSSVSDRGCRSGAYALRASWQARRDLPRDMRKGRAT